MFSPGMAPRSFADLTGNTDVSRNGSKFGRENGSANWIAGPVRWLDGTR